MPLIVTKPGMKTLRLERQPLEDEKTLQSYLAANPECLPVDQLRDGLRLLVVGREFSTGVGPIDALALDQEGSVYVIETKLYRNQDKRRVLAQMLDYGAGLWRAYARPGDFTTALEALAQATFKRSLAQACQEHFEIDQDEAASLAETAAANASGGRFRFVVLMDRIDDDLKNLIGYVNASSQFAILGVELEFYRYDTSMIVMPRLYGAETEGRSNPATVRIRDDVFFEQATARQSPEAVAALRDLYAFSSSLATTVGWGRGATGSFNPRFESVNPKSMYTVFSDGRLILNFPWLDQTDAGKRVTDFLAQRLPSIAVPLPADFKDKFVRIDAKVWMPSVKELLDVFRQAIAMGGAGRP